MTIWIHSTVNRNCLQDSEPLHPLHKLRVHPKTHTASLPSSPYFTSLAS